MKQFLSKGKKFLFSAQSSVLSAATIIMFMIIASRILGLVRQRILAHFFAPSELALFFAAFRLPDTIFEVLVFGTFSSAFIPVFTKSLKGGRKKAWEIAGSVTNIGLILFALFAVVIIFLSNRLYGFIAPGFEPFEREKIVEIVKILIIGQGFFVVSYVLTGVLESLRRFLVPALAPLFYNLGIILGTVILGPKLGLMGPAIGVLIGSASHFLIQFPLATKLGFRFSFKIKITEEVKKIGKLALPRVLELSFTQVSKSVELFLSSLISTASYTYFTFGNSLQLLPVGLFGTSIAKAALPTLSRQADRPLEFQKTLLRALYQMVYAALPVATILAVLRIPIVRLVYGTDIFAWEATVQTSLVLSAFAFGVVFQVATGLLARGFYALHDTKTPVAISISALTINIVLAFVLIRGFSLPAWGLAAAFSIGSAFQAITLFYLLGKRINGGFIIKTLAPLAKSTLSALGSGTVMYFLIKFFDRSVWVKRLSFLGRLEGTKTIDFERFVLDTRYTGNLFILTMFVCLVGMLVYIGLSILFKSHEFWDFVNLVKRVLIKRKSISIPTKEEEPVVPTPTDTASN
jgi:putative peptidoglycan lipid II flippase